MPEQPLQLRVGEDPEPRRRDPVDPEGRPGREHGSRRPPRERAPRADHVHDGPRPEGRARRRGAAAPRAGPADAGRTPRPGRRPRLCRDPGPRRFLRAGRERLRHAERRVRQRPARKPGPGPGRRRAPDRLRADERESGRGRPLRRRGGPRRLDDGARDGYVRRRQRLAPDPRHRDRGRDAPRHWGQRDGGAGAP